MSVNDLVLQLKGLVLVRDLLEIRGATRAEIDEHTVEIERVRQQLARLVAGGGYEAAAY